MAIFHCQTKPLSRSGGRSAVAASAYRAGVELTDERTGIVHNFTRRSGVESADLLLPDDAPDLDRGDLWNGAEAAEARKDARTAREWVTALPAELGADERRALALEFGRALVERYGVAVDVAIHAPGRRGDDRNHHAHLLATTRQLGPDGLGAKADIELSDKARIARGLEPARKEIEAVRALWAGLANGHLERAGRSERIDHRSLKAQGIDRVPTQHQGPAITAMERRGKEGRVRRALGLPERPGDVPSRVVEDRRQAQADAGRHREAALAHEGKAVNAELSALLEHRAALERQQVEQAERAAADLAARVAAISDRWAKLQESKAQDQPKAPTIEQPPAAQLPEQPQTSGRPGQRNYGTVPPEPKAPPKDPEQVYADLITPILEQIQAAALATQAAVSVERQAYRDASRAHHNSEPTGFVSKTLRKAKWERDGDALAAQGGPLREREEAARLAAEPKAIQRAALAELRRVAPGVIEAAQVAMRDRKAREQIEQVARDAEKERTAVGDAFAKLAERREDQDFSFRDGAAKWKATPQGLKDRIEAFNSLPKHERPAALERINRDPATKELIKGLIDQREQAINQRGHSR